MTVRVCDARQSMSKFTDAGHAYLPGMYQDSYVPGPLVDQDALRNCDW